MQKKRRILLLILSLSVLIVLSLGLSVTAGAASYELQYDSKNPHILTGYTGTLPSDLQIPDGVEQIAAGAFKGNRDIESLTIPDTVVRIGGQYSDSAGAFAGCSALRNVRIGNGVEFLGTAAFRDCERLTTVSFGEKLETIGLSAFRDCTNLGDIVIPDSVKLIRESAFAESGTTSVVIGESIELIEGYAFSGATRLSELAFREPEFRTEVTIGQGAFMGTALESVDLPDTIVSIGGQYSDSAGVFARCSALKSVKLGDGLVFLGTASFRNCEKLTTVSFGEKLETIGLSAFRDCTNLGDIVIPDSVKLIRESAFAESGTTSVIVGESIELIEEYAFSGATRLSELAFREPDFRTEVTIRRGAFMGTALESVELPDTIVSIGGQYSDSAGVFARCSALESVKLGDGLVFLGTASFRNCEKLTAVSFGEKLETIGLSAFRDCPNLGAVVTPDSVKLIREAAFADSGVTSAVIGESIELIEAYAFSGAARLSALTFRKPDFRTELTIRQGAFMGTALKTAVLPEATVSIGGQYSDSRGVFERCKELESAYIPGSVTLLGMNTFRECPSLRTILFGGSHDVWNKLAEKVSIPEGASVSYNAPSPAMPSAEPAPTPSPTATSTPAPPDSTETPSPSSAPNPGILEIRPGSDYVIEESSSGPVFTGITAGSSRAYVRVEDLISDLAVPDGTNVRIVDSEGRVCASDAAVATGDIIQVTGSDGERENVTIIVKGDVLGNGRMSLSQLVRMASAMLGTQPLSGPYLEAGDFSNSGKINLSDLVQEAKLVLDAMS